MDIERTIDDIERLEEMFETPDIRPLSPSDLSWIVCSVAAAFHGVSVFAGSQTMSGCQCGSVRVQ